MVRVVRDTDNGFKAYFEGLAELDGSRVKVGIQGREAAQIRPGGITMVDIGIIHEFGAPVANIPQRSFIRATGDVNARKYDRMTENIVRKLGDHPRSIDIKRELTQLGEVVRSDIINRIKDKIPPPLKPGTVRAKKGEDVPLIDTGLLINSISVDVQVA